MRLALTSAGERKIDASVEVASPTLTINGDAELLAQAVLNLLRNAVRAVSDTAAPRVILALLREPSGRTRIEVRDNGPGIPEERREEIFLPFYTTHKGCSGVGLSFSKQVALAHGGSIAALTAPQGGANIRILI